MAKTIESEPEQFTLQNSVLLYPNTEDHKNQAFRYLKQYIILCDLCYDVTFLNSSMPQKPVCSVKTLFLCEHPVCKTRIYFRQEWLVYVIVITLVRNDMQHGYWQIIIRIVTIRTAWAHIRRTDNYGRRKITAQIMYILCNKRKLVCLHKMSHNKSLLCEYNPLQSCRCIACDMYRQIYQRDY